MANNDVFGSPGLFAINSFYKKADSKTALLTVNVQGVSRTFSVVVVSCNGGLQVNHQNVQDFLGNNYLTVFGRSVNDFLLKCAETTDCSGKPRSDLVNIANTIKNATTTGQVPQITMTYNGLTIKGALIGVTFDLDLPYQSYALHIIGTQI